MDQALFNKPFVAYDGSAYCQRVLSIFKNMHDKFESSSFVYVWDPLKNYIPVNQKAPAIEKQLRNSLEGIQNVEMRMIEKQTEDNKTTNQYLLGECFKTKSSFILLGFFGSKGEKVRNSDLSSRVRKFVYDSKAIVAIVKKNATDSKKAVFCCDGSEVSLEGLKKASAFCHKFGLDLTVLHVFNQQTKFHGRQLKKQLKNMLESNKKNKFDIAVEQSDLVSALKQRQAGTEWVILTKNGYRGELYNQVYVGSHTTQVLTEVNCNLLIL